MTGRSALLLATALLAGTANASDDLDRLQQKAFREAVAEVEESVVQIETVGGAEEVDGRAVPEGPTTGLVVDTQGYIASSSINFVHDPSGILVRLADGRRLAARRIATDHSLKITLLRVDAQDALPSPVFANEADARVGQWAIAVGRAFDARQANVAIGVVSALNRVWGKALQTDAAVSPNNYGGPLVDLHGHVLGLLVPMSPASDDDTAGVEWYDSGIGFAVPARRLLQSVERLKSGEDSHAGRLGMTLKPSVAMADPPVVDSVLPNTPAEKAGLEPGDRIVRVGKDNMTRSSEFRYALARLYAGDTLDLLVRRGEKTVECRATLVAELEPYRRPVLGILPVRGNTEAGAGVDVRFTIPETPAAEAGIEPGDRILSLDGEAVENASDLRNRLARKKPGDEVSLEVERESIRRDVAFALALPPNSLLGELPAVPVDPEAAPGREVELALPEWENAIDAYLPKGYSPDSPPGLLLWLSAPAGERTGLDRWKTHADSRGFVVVTVAPSAEDRWLPGELDLVADVLELCRKRFSLDRDRIAVGGKLGGGTLAYQATLRKRDLVRGCTTIDAMLAGKVAMDHPKDRLSLLIGISEKNSSKQRIERAAAQLRDRGLPAIIWTRETPPGRLSDGDMANVARWIDQLDQL